MTLLNSIMMGPRLKVQRANRHIDELRQRTSPLDRDLYEIRNIKTRRSVIDLHPSVYQLTYRPKEPIPETFALIIGDVVHNLRAALDHLAKGILRTWGNPPPGPNESAYFPFAPRKNLVARPGLTAIEKALAGSTELLLNEIRPDNGPNEHFWTFYALDNDDKHGLVIPTVTLVQLKNAFMQTGRVRFFNQKINLDAASPQILIHSDSPITVKDDFQTAAEVKFSKGTPFENEPVIPTLFQIAEVVGKTLDAFERHIRSTKGIT